MATGHLRQDCIGGGGRAATGDQRSAFFFFPLKELSYSALEIFSFVFL